MRQKLLHIFKFRETSQFDKCLGVPLSRKNLRRGDFQYIVDQVIVKLINWKVNSLSFVGLTVLAKSILEAIPIYPMMNKFTP